MRQLITSFLICAGTILSAQVFSENFDGGVPGSMTQVTINGNQNWGPCGTNTGGAPCPITGSGSATFFVANYTQYSTALVTPEMDLSSGVYKLTFKHAQRAWGSDINQLHVEISTNGSTWTNVASYTDEVYDVTTRSITLNAFNPTATTKVRFRAVNKYGYRLILDDIQISEVTTDDLALTKVDLPAILAQGNIDIKGTVKNEGFNNITSFDLNWQADGGAVNTQTLTGQNIAPGQEFNFTHSDAWTATVGMHAIKVWVSNPNVTDANAANDEITSSVSVASNSTKKVPLMEKFSSSTCPPCYSFNTTSFNPFFDNYGHDKAVFISYQVNWPGAGDPYYTTEVGNRVSYYGINAAPTLLFNSVDVGMPNTAGLQAVLDDLLENDNQGYFKINADHTIEGNTINVSLDVTPYLTGDFKVHAVVIEKITTGNVATNGETSFHHVFMKGLPNMGGTTMSFVHDVPQSLTLSADLSNTHVEEMSDLAVVVFVQNIATKEIMQSAYTIASGIEMGVGEVNASQIAIVPNPTTGIVNVFTDKAVDMQIFDMTGRNVFAQKAVNNNASLNLSNLGKGVFIVKFNKEDGTSVTKKLVIK